MIFGLAEIILQADEWQRETPGKSSQKWPKSTAETLPSQVLWWQKTLKYQGFLVPIKCEARQAISSLLPRDPPPFEGGWSREFLRSAKRLGTAKRILSVGCYAFKIIRKQAAYLIFLSGKVLKLLHARGVRKCEIADRFRTRVQIQKCRFAPDKQILRRRVLYPAELLRLLSIQF